MSAPPAPGRFCPACGATNPPWSPACLRCQRPLPPSGIPAAPAPPPLLPPPGVNVPGYAPPPATGMWAPPAQSYPPPPPPPSKSHRGVWVVVAVVLVVVVALLVLFLSGAIPGLGSSGSPTGSNTQSFSFSVTSSGVERSFPGGDTVQFSWHSVSGDSVSFYVFTSAGGEVYGQSAASGSGSFTANSHYNYDFEVLDNSQTVDVSGTY
jgi:hypothetical protein